MERKGMRGSWLKRLVICFLAVLALGGVWSLRGPLLWSLACPLIADGPAPPGCYLWLRTEDGIFIDGPPSCKLAAYLRGTIPAGKILLVDARPCRLAKFGIVPPFATAAKRELQAYGVPASAIEILPGHQRGLEAELPVVSRFLAANRRAEVQLLCSRFSGAAYRRTIARVLPAEQAARVSFFGVLSPYYNETNWWQSRSGVREFMFGWLQRIYGVIRAGDARGPIDWDPDAYERFLAQAVAKERS